MKRILKVYSKTVSILTETAVDIYKNYVGDSTGFLLESYDKNYDRFSWGRTRKRCCARWMDSLLSAGGTEVGILCRETRQRR